LFESGVVANFAASRLALKTDRRLRVFSETCYLSLDFHRSTGVAITRDANLDVLALAKDKNLEDLGQMANLDFGKMVKVEPLAIVERDPLRTELEMFLDCVRNGGTPPVTAADGLAAVRLAAQIVESLSSHAWDGEGGARVGLSAKIFQETPD
jgi:predicted dehydrogenase